MQTLDLGGVYDGLCKHRQMYNLRSLVCYYGQHLHVFHSRQQNEIHVMLPTVAYQAAQVVDGSSWFIFDDTSMLLVGNWADVVKKCVRGRIQASILSFEHAL